MSMCLIELDPYFQVRNSRKFDNKKKQTLGKAGVRNRLLRIKQVVTLFQLVTERFSFFSIKLAENGWLDKKRQGQDFLRLPRKCLN